MWIKALKAFTVRDSETGDLSSIAHGAIAEVSNTLGQSLIEDGIAEAYEGNMTSFGKLVQSTITRVTADMLEGATNIGTYAFSGCSSLTSVEIPNGVTKIGESAFAGCTSLTSVEIPNSVTSIGARVFEDCSSLTSVTVLATTPPALIPPSFVGASSSSKIYVPAESVETYKAASGWKEYASKIQAIPS